jgi:hypothetical protein
LLWHLHHHHCGNGPPDLDFHTAGMLGTHGAWYERHKDEADAQTHMDTELAGLRGATRGQNDRNGEVPSEHPLPQRRRIRLNAAVIEKNSQRRNPMSTKTTTMKALIEAVQDVASDDAEAVAVLQHLLKTRRMLAERPGAVTQLSKAFF